MSQEEPKVGERYQVECVLGEGRFATVYSARDTQAERKVAIKVFHPDLAKKAGGGRRPFLKAKRSDTSVHPAVVPILDRGLTQDGAPFVVMELLRGQTLEQEVRDCGPLAMRRAFEIVEIMLEGLAAIHAKGIVHRNIHPGNIFLVTPDSPGPAARILDLGVAKDLVNHLAVSPDVIGSTSYLAPEFLLKPTKTWTPTVDVFAAGMVFFFMLTGRLPFEKNDTEYGVEAHQKTLLIYRSLDSLPNPAMFVRVLRAVDEVISRAIAIKPEERFRDAAEMRDAFREAKASVNLSLIEGEAPPMAQPARSSHPGEPAPIWPRTTKAKGSTSKQPPKPEHVGTPLAAEPTAAAPERAAGQKPFVLPPPAGAPAGSPPGPPLPKPSEPPPVPDDNEPTLAIPEKQLAQAVGEEPPSSGELLGLEAPATVVDNRIEPPRHPASDIVDIEIEAPPAAEPKAGQSDEFYEPTLTLSEDDLQECSAPSLTCSEPNEGDDVRPTLILENEDEAGAEPAAAPEPAPARDNEADRVTAPVIHPRPPPAKPSNPPRPKPSQRLTSSQRTTLIVLLVAVVVVVTFLAGLFVGQVSCAF